jgi:uncharacterized Rmd1/YagE family protein
MILASDIASSQPQQVPGLVGAKRESCDRARLPEALACCDTIFAKAIFLGERIDMRRLTSDTWLGSSPPILSTGPTGVAVLFRYGVVVLFNTTPPAREDSFLQEIAVFVHGPYGAPETEQITLRLAPDRVEAVDGDMLYLREFDLERLQLVAVVLSKSVVLAEYEQWVSSNVDQIEPFAVELQTQGRSGRNMRKLLQQIGSVLATEHKMVARVEVPDKPEMLWEHPQLESLYLRLADEFEIDERSAALERKLALASRTVTTVLELLQNRRALRVEWYIVILIVLEIVLMSYELFWRGM